MTIYPWVAGIDYGPRKGTLGLELHMSEGSDNLAGYLSRHQGETDAEWRTRVRGVSCNAAILSTGEVIQMVPWANASGNVNPADRALEYGYYGHSKLVDVLGDHWPDPNTWSISAELAGFRATGPTDKQRDAAIAWGLDMRGRFPSLRGAWGHHDQAPKACPGLSANMQAIFAGVGGHGLWEVDVVPAPITDETPKIVTTKAVSTWYDLDGKTVLSTGHAALPPRPSPYGVGTQRAIFATVGGSRRIVLIIPATVAAVPVVDCTQAVADAKAAEHERVRAAALAAVGAI